MANKIEKIAKVQEKLDEQLTQGLTTEWTENNKGDVEYTGGGEVKIPKLSVGGLGNYANGFKRGSFTFEFETRKMEQDRGVTFLMDVKDEEETGGILKIASVLAELQRTQAIPEVDAYRLSKIASTALAEEGQYKDNYTPAKETIIDEIKAAIRKIRNNGYTGECVIHANSDTLAEIEKAQPVVQSLMTFSNGGIDTQVRHIDRNPIIETSDERMVSKIELNDGSKEFGFKRASDAKTVNFIVAARNAAIGVRKIDNIRIFDPSINQEAHGWKADYRLYHDLWIFDNRKKTIFACIKEEK